MIKTVEISKNVYEAATFLSYDKYIVLWNYVISSLPQVQTILYFEFLWDKRIQVALFTLWFKYWEINQLSQVTITRKELEWLIF